MKKIFSMMCLACGAMILPACSNDSEMAEVASQPEAVEVSLNMGGDAISISESPITRAGNSKKFYAINVYYKVPVEKDGETVFEWRKYAYGLFDNIAAMKISLMTNEKYKFECETVEEDRDILYSRFVNGKNVYFEPFATYEETTKKDPLHLTKEKNKFILSSYYNLETIDMSKVMEKRKENAEKKQDKDGTMGIKALVKYEEGTNVVAGLTKKSETVDGKAINFVETYYPAVDRMYGAVEDYTPTVNGSVTIPMKRTSFHLTFNIIPPAESNGVLRVSCDSLFGDINIPHGDGKTVSFESYFAFKNQDECIRFNDYSIKRTVTVVWADNKGDVRSFGKEFSAKRNVNTTINIDPNSFNNANVYIGDDTPLGQETINIGGNATEIVVNP